MNKGTNFSTQTQFLQMDCPKSCIPLQIDDGEEQGSGEREREREREPYL